MSEKCFEAFFCSSVGWNWKNGKKRVKINVFEKNEKSTIFTIFLHEKSESSLNVGDIVFNGHDSSFNVYFDCSELISNIIVMLWLSYFAQTSKNVSEKPKFAENCTSG